ncbi:MAG: immunity 22 family protein [Candidatus Cloacimonetes bacterium]|nr:immunity 22 family protein [Candidatus Cloacimonadota bacterium]
MKSKKTLSLFIGNLDSPQEFEEYMTTSYSKKEGHIKSNFMADFDLEVIDEDLVEAQIRHKRTIDVETLVKDFSYFPSFRKEVIKRVNLPGKANVVIILFDYFADELGREPIPVKEGYMKFCGTYEYIDQ